MKAKRADEIKASPVSVPPLAEDRVRELILDAVSEVRREAQERLESFEAMLRSRGVL